MWYSLLVTVKLINSSESPLCRAAGHVALEPLLVLLQMCPVMKPIRIMPRGERGKLCSANLNAEFLHENYHLAVSHSALLAGHAVWTHVGTSTTDR